MVPLYQFVRTILANFLRIRSLDFHMKSWVGECKILMELNFLMKIFALWASGLGLYIAYKRLIDTEWQSLLSCKFLFPMQHCEKKIAFEIFWCYFEALQKILFCITTALSMQEYGFSLTRTLPYKDRIHNSVHMRENTGQLKPVFLHT